MGKEIPITRQIQLKFTQWNSKSTFISTISYDFSPRFNNFNPNSITSRGILQYHRPIIDKSNFQSQNQAKTLVHIINNLPPLK